MHLKGWFQVHKMHLKNNRIMKKCIFIFALLVMVITQVEAQKILSHTTTIAKYAGSSISYVENSNGNGYYDVCLSSADLKSVGTKLVTTNRERIILGFESKEAMIKCLKFLYDFDKGEGYYIDLENKTGNTALSVKKGFIFGGIYDIDKPAISQWVLGKLLNLIGVSVKKKDEANKKEEDDIYTNPSSLF